MAQSFIAEATTSATASSSRSPSLIVLWICLNTSLGSRCCIARSVNTSAAKVFSTGSRTGCVILPLSSFQAEMAEMASWRIVVGMGSPDGGGGGPADRAGGFGALLRGRAELQVGGDKWPKGQIAKAPKGLRRALPGDRFAAFGNSALWPFFPP